MAKLKAGILGGFSGKIGNIVGGTWKGIDYMRGLALSVANPKTAKQTAQRGAFTEIVKFTKSILVGAIKPLWDRFAVRQSGYNAFIQGNIKNFDTDGIKKDTNLVLSRGSLTPEAVSGVSSNANQTTVSYDTTNSSGTGNATATDEHYGIAYNATQQIFATSYAEEVRTATVHVLTFPNETASGDVILLYTAYRKADGTLVSNGTANMVTV